MYVYMYIHWQLDRLPEKNTNSSDAAICPVANLISRQDMERFLNCVHEKKSGNQVLTFSLMSIFASACSNGCLGLES